MAEVRQLTIVEALQLVNDGGALDDLNTELSKVSKAVELTGKDGSVSLTLKVKRLGSGQVQITDDVKATVPRAAGDPTIFYTDEETGALSRDNPRQGRLIA